MKRPITNLVIGWLALFFAFNLSAQTTTFTVSPQMVNGDPGDQFTVDLTVTDFDDIVSFQFSLNWDQTAIDYVSVGNFNGDLTGFGNANIGTSGTANGELSVSWFDPNVEGVTLADGSVLFSLTFEILSTNGTTIEITGDPTTIEVINGNSQEVTLIAENCEVNGGSGGGGGGGGSSDLTITASDETAAAGSNVCLAVTAVNFTEIVSIQYSMHWDETILTYTGVQSFGLSGMTNANFGTTGTANGDLTFSWFDANAVGVTVPNGTTLYEVCFDVIGSNGDVSSFTFDGTPTNIEVIDGNSQAVPVTFNEGSVTVNGGTPPPTMGFAVIASDEEVSSGSNFCTKISVQDFTNIVSMQYTMEWDENLFTYTGQGNFGLPGMTNASFGSTMAADGFLTMSWLDPDVSGITLNDGDVIYEVCFDAVGANDCNNSSLFEFTGSQAVIEVIDGDGNEVTFQSVPGELTICNGPTPGGLTFTAGEETAGEGEQVCVPFSVDAFDCILSSQFSIHFDETILEYVGVQSFGLPDLTNGNFGTNAAGNGTITFSWFDNQATGVTVADGTVIFEMCFNVLGQDGDVSSITFDGNPTSIEVIDCNNQSITPDFNNGSVTVETLSCMGGVSIIDAIVNNVPCHGQSTGSIDLSVGGGDNTYDFNWENSAGQQVGTGEDLTNVGADTYCVTVTSCGGTEMAMGCYTISQPNSALLVSGTVTNPPCFGDDSGSIDIVVTGGTPTGVGCFNYTYAWSNGETTQDLVGVGAGTYSVTITDCNGCQIFESFNIVSSPSELSATVTPTPVTCFGDCDGTITVAGNGGVAPYQYRVTGNGVNTGYLPTTFFNDLCPGAYFVSIRDAFNCVETMTVQITTPQELTATTSPTNATNGCNGAIALSPSGGTQPLSYAWEGPNNYTSTSQNISNLCPGEYCVTITDGNDCTFTTCATAVAPMSLLPATIQDACFGETNGEITINIDGGAAPFTFQWTGNLMGGPTVTDVPPGSYTVVVTSVDGQSETMSVTVGEAASAVSVNQVLENDLTTPSSCDGVISVNANGGFGGPYTFQWSNISQTTMTVNNLCGGDYSVTATDSQGCTGTAGVWTIEWNPDQLVVNMDANVICGNASDGIIDIVVTGGFGPYDFTFDSNTGTTPNNINNDADGVVQVTGLEPGTYTVTVTDSAPGLQQQTVVQNEEVEAVVIILMETTIFPVTNASQNNGKIDIEVVGGDIPYNYQWSNGFTGQNPSGLEPGEYDLTVTDDNGCDVVFQNILVEAFTASAVTNPPACPQDVDGSITVTPDGSLNEPFTYIWTNQAGQNVGDNDSTLTDQPPGTYTVTITDTLGRSITQTFDLDAVSDLTGFAEATTDYHGFEVSCHMSQNGGAVAMPSNGVEPYTFNWSNGSTSPELQGVGADTYTVTVTDAADCTFEDVVILNSPEDLEVAVETGREGCGENTGFATANVISTVVPGPFTYHWNDELEQNSKTAILLAGGVYSVTVTDANGCVDVSTGEVPDYEELVVVGTSEPDQGGPDGKAIAVVMGGTWPYEFEWKDYIVTDSILTELLPGTYFVKVSDASDCEVLTSIVVEDETVCLDALTVITPEGDGFNEEFKIGCLSRYSDNHLEIFNRWGQLVYETDNYSDADLWRGTTRRGDDVPDGVYFYVFDYLDPVSGARETKKGAVSVLRK